MVQKRAIIREKEINEINKRLVLKIVKEGNSIMNPNCQINKEIAEKRTVINNPVNNK